MGIKEKSVMVKWNNSNKGYYQSKGYQFTKEKEEFEVNIEDLTKGSIALITAFCDECGICNEKQMTYGSYNHTIDRSGGVYRCKKCSRIMAGEKLILPIEEVKLRLINIHNGKIKIIEDSYISTNKTAKFYCSVCGCTWNTNPNNILTKHHNCPDCSKRNSTEIKVKNYLKTILDLKIYEIESQKGFDDLRSNNYPLKFDICITNKNTSKMYLFELQGEQHYRAVDFSGKMNETEVKEQFIDLVRRDNQKKIYCKLNSIDLIEIPYWEYKNVERYIKNFLINMNFKLAEIPNQLINYTYNDRIEVAEAIRKHKFEINKNTTKDELIAIYKICEIFDIKKTTAHRKVNEILDGKVMYEESKYKDYIDKYRELSLHQKSANCIKKYFTKDEENNICILYQNEKLSMMDIGKIYKVGHVIVSKVLKDNNIEIRDKTSKIIRSNSMLTENQVKDIKLMLKDKNNKISDIAKKYNVKDNVIYKIKSNKTWVNITI
jgi:hypothetical protein